jgi:hypothetical protein
LPEKLSAMRASLRLIFPLRHHVGFTSA